MKMGISQDRRCLSIKIRGRQPVAARSELYNLHADAGEQEDLVDELDQVAEQMETKLRAYSWQPMVAESEALSPELTERLRALGYLE